MTPMVLAALWEGAACGYGRHGGQAELLSSAYFQAERNPARQGAPAEKGRADDFR